MTQDRDDASDRNRDAEDRPEGRPLRAPARDRPNKPPFLLRPPTRRRGTRAQ